MNLKLVRIPFYVFTQISQLSCLLRLGSDGRLVFRTCIGGKAPLHKLAFQWLMISLNSIVVLIATVRYCFFSQRMAHKCWQCLLLLAFCLCGILAECSSNAMRRRAKRADQLPKWMRDWASAPPASAAYLQERRNRIQRLLSEQRALEPPGYSRKVPSLWQRIYARGKGESGDPTPKAAFMPPKKPRFIYQITYRRPFPTIPETQGDPYKNPMALMNFNPRDREALTPRAAKVPSIKFPRPTDRLTSQMETIPEMPFRDTAEEWPWMERKMTPFAARWPDKMDQLQRVRQPPALMTLPEEFSETLAYPPMLRPERRKPSSEWIRQNRRPKGRGRRVHWAGLGRGRG